MKVISGILKKVLDEQQFESIAQNEINAEQLTLYDTIKYYNHEDIESAYLSVRISYRELDDKGNDKYIFNQEKQEYQQSYHTSDKLYAFGKEMRILLELKEYAPVKISYVVDEKEGKKFNRIICIQDQRSGKL